MTRKAPSSLTVEAKKIWLSICKENMGADTYFYTVLRVALEAFGRLQEARALVDLEGATLKNPAGYVREHPALKIEKEARAGFLAAIRMLNLDQEQLGDIGRPPGS